MKTVWWGYEDIYAEQTESRNRSTNVPRHFRGEGEDFTDDAGKSWILIQRKNEPQSYLKPHMKINSTWTTQLNIKAIKLLEENNPEGGKDNLGHRKQ